MTEIENTGIQTLSDEQMEEAAGGKGGQRCTYGQIFESAFPERCCKNCPEFTKEQFSKSEAAKKYKFTCHFFDDRFEWKNVDVWNFF